MMYLVDTWESPDLGFRFRWEVGTYFNRLSVRRCLTCTQLHLEHRNVAGRDIDMWQYRAQTSCACIQSLNRRVSLHTHTHTLTHLHTHSHTHFFFVGTEGLLKGSINVGRGASKVGKGGNKTSLKVRKGERINH